MNNDNMKENSAEENKVDLRWGTEEIIRVEIENLQLVVNKLADRVNTLAYKENMMSGKVRYTPHLYANAIIEDTSDFHNFWGDDKMHEAAEMSRVDFLREVAEHLLVYCNHNSQEVEK